MTKRCLAMTIGLVLATLAVGCSREEEPATAALRVNCARLTEAFAADVTSRAPLSDLPDDLRQAVAGALAGAGHVCLDAPATSQSCNAGDARKPDIRTCCQFSEPPRARLLGVASRVKLDGTEGIVVDLELEPRLAEAATTSRCAVPTCTDDVATARAALGIRGRVVRAEGTTSVAIEMELDPPLALDCRLPG